MEWANKHVKDMPDSAILPRLPGRQMLFAELIRLVPARSWHVSHDQGRVLNLSCMPPLSAAEAV